jgi:hypothetical protein
MISAAFSHLPSASAAPAATANASSTSRSKTGGASAAAAASARSAISPGTAAEGIAVAATAARKVTTSNSVGSAPIAYTRSASIADAGPTPIAHASPSAGTGQVATLPANLLPGARLTIRERIATRRSAKAICGCPVFVGSPAAMLGIVTVISDPSTEITLRPVQRMQNLLEEIVLADQVGLDVFGIGEHHRSEFVDSAPVVILGAGATRTKNIRLSSAVTVLSAADPVRVFQEFATLDLISHGRAEIVAGRGSSVEAFPLFGFDLDDYDSLYAEKLDLLLKIRGNTHVHWTHQHPKFGHPQ